MGAGTYWHLHDEHLCNWKGLVRLKSVSMTARDLCGAKLSGNKDNLQSSSESRKGLIGVSRSTVQTTVVS
jgi:hypothetical protein